MSDHLIVPALEFHADAYRRFGYAGSTYDYVLTEGVVFTGAPLPACYPSGRSGECFQNALALCFGDIDLLYVEGYAVRPGIGLVIHHAWCVADGVEGAQVIDPTWRDPECCQYMGVVFEPEWVVDLGYTGMALDTVLRARLVDGEAS